MILSIDTIGPKAQRTKQKPPPILCIVAYPILASAITVWLSTQTGSDDLHTDKPRLVTRQRALTTSLLTRRAQVIDLRIYEARRSTAACTITYSTGNPL